MFGEGLSGNSIYIMLGAIAGAVLLAVLVIIIVVCCVVGAKKKKSAATASTVEVTQTTAEENAETVEAEEETATATAAETEPEKEIKAEKKEVKPVEKKTNTTKTYHISKRSDTNMWQIKAAGAAKAIKLFKTQKEAIDYCKTLADNQDANIMIHKEDGSFRKLTY